MRGRRVLMESLVSHGVRHIFGNPGTTETPLLDSLPAYPQINYVMTLHEGVAVGAASFYAQASGRIPVVNLHVAPGLGNAIGSLYGALKANSPLVVTAGQQDTRMRLTNPLLSHDLVSMAAPVTSGACRSNGRTRSPPSFAALSRWQPTSREAPSSYPCRSTSWSRRPRWTPSGQTNCGDLRNRIPEALSRSLCCS
jgi:glyoxylate carboligase